MIAISFILMIVGGVILLVREAKKTLDILRDIEQIEEETRKVKDDIRRVSNKA